MLRILAVLIFGVVLPVLAADEIVEEALRDGQYAQSKVEIPAMLLDRVVEVVEFAFRIGAAKKVSGDDFHHVHLLFAPDRQEEWRLVEPDAILGHTDETLQTSRRRNVMQVVGQNPAVLPCGIGLALRRQFRSTNICTVTGADLGLENLVDILFVLADHVDVEEVGNAKNIRLIGGKRVLFFLFGVVPK